MSFADGPAILGRWVDASVVAQRYRRQSDAFFGGGRIASSSIGENFECAAVGEARQGVGKVCEVFLVDDIEPIDDGRYALFVAAMVFVAVTIITAGVMILNGFVPILRDFDRWR